MEEIKHKLSRLASPYPFTVSFEGDEIMFQQELIDKRFKQISFSEHTILTVMKETTVEEFLDYITLYLRTL